MSFISVSFSIPFDDSSIMGWEAFFSSFFYSYLFLYSYRTYWGLNWLNFVFLLIFIHNQIHICFFSFSWCNFEPISQSPMILHLEKHTDFLWKNMEPIHKGFQGNNTVDLYNGFRIWLLILSFWYLVLYNSFITGQLWKYSNTMYFGAISTLLNIETIIHPIPITPILSFPSSIQVSVEPSFLRFCGSKIKLSTFFHSKTHTIPRMKKLFF